LPEKATTPGWLYSEHPTTSIRFDESPLSEYRPCQGRLAMRRHFGPAAAGLCAAHGIFGRHDRTRRDRRALLKSDRSDTVLQESLVFPEECDRKFKVNDGPHRLL
jgi:hypothetical protein